MSAAAVIRLLRRRFGTPSPDVELLRAYVTDGNADAFRTLVERHGPMVLRFCRRRLRDDHAADDAFQATFLTLARSAASVRRPEALAAWLYRTALRICDKARAAQARRRAAEANVTPSRSSDALADASARELLDALDEELDRLPERHRLPLTLVYWQGLSHAEAARKLGLTPAAVHGRLDRGRAKLAIRMRRRGFGPSDLRALLVAPLAVAAVPRGLLAATAGLAAEPWSKSIPGAVLALTAGATASKLVPAAVVCVLLAGTGLLALATGAPWRAASVSDENEIQPPVTRAPDTAVAPQVDAFGDPVPDGAIARLGTLRYRSDSYVSHVTLLPDRRHVAGGGGLGISVWEVATGRLIHQIKHAVIGEDFYGVFGPIAIAPGGLSFAVAVASTRGGFVLLDPATGRAARIIGEVNQRILSLTFKPDGRQIISLDAAGMVCSWLATGEKVREFAGPERTVTGITLSPDGRTLAAGSDVRDGTATIFLWDATTGVLLRTLAGHSTAVRTLRFTPDGRQLVTGGASDLRLWDVATGRELREFRGHAAERNGAPCQIHSLAISPDGRHLASAGTDLTVRVWELATGDSAGQPDASALIRNSLAFADDRTLLIGSRQMLHVWDLPTKSYTNRSGDLESGFSDLQFAPDGRTITSVSMDGSAFLWDSANGRAMQSFKLTPWPNRRITPDARSAVDGTGRGHPMTVYELVTGWEVHRLPGDNQLPIAFWANGRRLATLNILSGLVTVFDMETEAIVAQFDPPPGAVPLREQGLVIVTDAAFAPDGASLFVAYQLAPVCQWDLGTGTLARQFPGPKGGRAVIAVTPDGRRLAIMADGECRLVEVSSGEECGQFTVANAKRLFLRHIVVSPDGSLLAGANDNITVGLERQIELWDARGGRWLAHLTGHWRRSELTSLTFSPESQRLASGSGVDALIWDVSRFRRQPAVRLRAAEQQSLWADLAGDAKTAYQAVGNWLADRDSALAFIRRHVHPPAAAPREQVASLLQRLEDPSLAQRELASQALAQLGPDAIEPVRAALARQPSAEARQHMEKAIASWVAQVLQAVRALEILEVVGTPDARKLLAELAAGDPTARLTSEAKASLMRLQRQH